MGLQFQQCGVVHHSAAGHQHRSCSTDRPEFTDHSAGSGQLLYSANGLLVVHSDCGHWVVPPTTVLRLAAGTSYNLRKADQVSVHTVELAEPLSHRLPDESCLYKLTPLLRELLQALSTDPAASSNGSKAALLVELLLETGAWNEEATPRCIGMPSDPRVAHICDYVHNNLDAPKTLQEWAAELKNDPRTLHRLFVQEFGMPFVQWRQQARLMAALEWLAEGRQVMDVALDLGYQTQSAFTAMFRRQMGITPTEWQEKRRPLYCKL